MTAPILWDWRNLLQQRSETNKCKCFFSTRIIILQNKWYDMKSNGIFGSEVFYSPGTGCWILHIYSDIGVLRSVIDRHPLIISAAITSQYQLVFFLPWSRSSVIILLVWFQVLSINIIFFSLVPSLLLFEMPSLGFFSSSGSIFACLRTGSLEQSSSLAQTPFLVYFWRWKAISFTETELGPGNISAIWMKKTEIWMSIKSNKTGIIVLKNRNFLPCL